MRKLMITISALRVRQGQRSVLAKADLVDPSDPVIQHEGSHRLSSRGITVADPCDEGFVTAAAFAARHLVEAKQAQHSPPGSSAAPFKPTALYVSLLSVQAGELRGKVPVVSQLVPLDTSSVYLLLASEDENFEGEIVGALLHSSHHPSHPIWDTLSQAIDLVLGTTLN